MGIEAPAFRRLGEPVELFAGTMRPATRNQRERWPDRIAWFQTVELTIPGETHYSDWRFLARVEHKAEINLVWSLPGVELPVHFHTDGPTCDHCGKKRKRNDTLVIEHPAEGQLRVGKQCAKEFLGEKGAQEILTQAKWLADLARAMEELADADSYFGGSGRAYAWPLVEVLAWAAASIRRRGWVSSKMARESERGPMSTASDVFGDLTWKPSRGNTEPPTPPADQDVREAEETETWMRALELGSSGYLNNLKALSGEFIDMKRMGLAVSAVSAMQREQNRLTYAKKKKTQAAIDRETSKWVGDIGDRFGGAKSSDPDAIPVTIVSTYGRESDYGYTTLYTMRDEQGNILKWWASRYDDETEKGDEMLLTGTVKKHDDYQGTKQTVITRGKLEER